MKMFESQLQSLKKQVDTTPWLRWAALAIAVLLALFVLQSLDNVRVARRKATVEAAANLERILALQGQDAWLTRAKDATQMRDSLRAQLPEVATPGLAQAALQNWLRDLTKNFGKEQNLSIRVNQSGPVDKLPGVLRVNASLSGNLTPRQALVVLRRIETTNNLIVLETVDMQSDSSNTLQLTLNAYYRVPGISTP